MGPLFRNNMQCRLNNFQCLRCPEISSLEGGLNFGKSQIRWMRDVRNERQCGGEGGSINCLTALYESERCLRTRCWTKVQGLFSAQLRAAWSVLWLTGFVWAGAIAFFATLRRICVFTDRDFQHLSRSLGTPNLVCDLRTLCFFIASGPYASEHCTHFTWIVPYFHAICHVNAVSEILINNFSTRDTHTHICVRATAWTQLVLQCWSSSVPKWKREQAISQKNGILSSTDVGTENFRWMLSTLSCPLLFVFKILQTILSSPSPGVALRELLGFTARRCYRTSSPTLESVLRCLTLGTLDSALRVPHV